MLEGKQNPDNITFKKQWDEFNCLKGWWVDMQWNGRIKKHNLQCFADITSGYIRWGGDFHNIPQFIKGKHKYSYDKKTKKKGG